MSFTNYRLSAGLVFAISLAIASIGGAAVATSASAAPTTATPIERQAVVFGQHVRYIEAGSGPPLILVHGLAGSSLHWQQVIVPLAQRHHVIALDQIGFGRSDKPLLDYRAETFVDFLDEFMRVRHLPKATIVGSSLGGWVAALLAIEHPERVDRLVLVDSAGMAGLTDHLGPKLMMALRQATLDDARVLDPLLFADPRPYNSDQALRAAFTAHVNAGDGYTVGKVMDAIERKEDMLDGHLGAIKVPTLILWGREDRTVPLKFGESIQRGIAGAKLVVFDHCGHAPQIECPKPFESALEEFLSRGG
jgi:pimeloyl-ACP methyl ester carboxylesterase